MAIETILKETGRGVVTIESTMPVGEAISILRRAKTDALVVSDDGTEVLGLVSHHDLVRALKSNGIDRLMPRAVAEIMRRTTATCRPDESLRRVMTRMTARGLGHIPVVGDNGMCGIVSLADIVNRRLQRAKAEAAALRDSIVLPV